MREGDYSATLTIDDEVYSQCLTLHAIPGADSSALWMLLSLGSMSIWLC